jgi:hypothetical protein
VKTLQTKIHTYRFDMDKPEDVRAYEELINHSDKRFGQRRRRLRHNEFAKGVAKSL